MKRSDVFASLDKEASEALTGFPDSRGRCLNSESDSYAILLALRSVASSIFGYGSSEHLQIAAYFDSLRCELFIGPLPLGVPHVG